MINNMIKCLGKSRLQDVKSRRNLKYGGGYEPVGNWVRGNDSFGTNDSLSVLMTHTYIKLSRHIQSVKKEIRS